MLPLADVRVVSVEQFGAGPWGTLQLADLGAEVIKIEDPASGGDVGRYVPPFQEGEDSLFFETFNRGKKSVSLDLRHPDARGVLRGPRARCPTPSTRTCAATSRRSSGSPTTQLKDVNPRIVCCSLSGFGMTGPRAAEGGYDYMMQGLAGWQSLTGEPGRAADEERALARRPLRRLRVGDRAARRDLARAARRRRLRLRRLAVRDGPARADVHRPWAATHGYVPPRRRNSAHPTIVPFQNFEAADGWIVVGAAEAEVLGAAVRGDRAARAERAIRASRRWRPATSTATS